MLSFSGDMMEIFVVDVGFDGPLTLKQIYCDKSFATIMPLYIGVLYVDQLQGHNTQ